MRIISGSHRGKQIIPDKSFTARPTTDFAKENLFNVLNNYMERGASKIIAVELNYKHFAFIKHTAQQLGFKNMQVYKNDAFLACRKLRGTAFDIVFADPPYRLENIREIPAAIFDNGLLAERGIAIIEHPAFIDFSAHPRFSEHREYGSVNFSLFR